MGLDYGAAKVLEAGVPSPVLEDGHLLNVDRGDPSGFRDAEHVVQNEPVMIDELGGGRRVAEVAFAWGVGVERCERGRVDRQIDAFVGDLGEPFAAIAE